MKPLWPRGLGPVTLRSMLRSEPSVDSHPASQAPRPRPARPPGHVWNFDFLRTSPCRTVCPKVLEQKRAVVAEACEAPAQKGKVARAPPQRQKTRARAHEAGRGGVGGSRDAWLPNSLARRHGEPRSRPSVCFWAGTSCTRRAEAPAARRRASGPRGDSDGLLVLAQAPGHCALVLSSAAAFLDVEELFFLTVCLPEGPKRRFLHIVCWERSQGFTPPASEAEAKRDRWLEGA